MKRLLFFLLSCSAVYAQQNALMLPWTPQQFTNTNGALLVSGKVCTYLAGTSTGTATFTDATASVSNAIPPNAILLDSTARPTSGGIWLAPNKAYKIVTMTAGSDGTCNTGVVVKTQDQVVVPSGTSPSTIFGSTCSVSALQNALFNTAPTGGTVDYRACTAWSSQITNATVTVNIPAGVTLLLGPVGPTCTITTANTPCWALIGDNARLLGTGSSNEDAAINSQTGPRTILIGSGLGSTTDMIDVRCTGCGAFAGIEIGNLVIQMNSTRTGTNGQHGISTTSLDGANIHDVDVYYANGGDCFHFDSGTSGSAFYRVSLDRLLARVCGGSAAPVGSGFHFLTPSGSGEMRLITARTLIYQGYDFNNSTTPYGKAGYYFEIPAGSAVTQNIGEFHCDGCRSEGSVSGANFGGLVIDQQGNGFVHEIYFNGFLEDNFNANVGCAFNILRNNPANVLGLYVEITSANYSGCSTTNITTANVSGTYHVKTRDGGSPNFTANQMNFTSNSTAAAGAATNFPNSGLGIVGLSGARSHWYVASGGDWIQERTDGSVIPLWDFDAQNNRFWPQVDNASDLGIVNNKNWKSLSTYRHNIQEGTAPAATANVDTCYADSTAHIIRCAFNNGSFGPLVTAAPCTTSQRTESGADSNLLTCAIPNQAGSYRIRFVLSVSAANAATLGWTATWTDANGTVNNAITNLAMTGPNSGSAAPALTFTTSSPADFYGQADIDTNGSASIVVKLTFSGTSFTAKASATVERII